MRHRFAVWMLYHCLCLQPTRVCSIRTLAYSAADSGLHLSLLFSLCINTTTFLTNLDRPRLVRHMELFSESSCFQSSPNPMSPIEADRFHLIPLEPVDEVGCFSLLFPGGKIHIWLGSSSAAHNDEISLVAMSVEFIKSNIDPLVPSGLKYQDEKRALNSRIKHCHRDIDTVQGVFFTDPT